MSLAQKLRDTATAYERVAEAVVLDPSLGVYAEEVQLLKIRCYIGMAFGLRDLALEVDRAETAVSA